MPTPEELARQEIDRQLEAAGWQVQDFKTMHIHAAAGVAIREFELKAGTVDYLLYAGGQAIGVVEAKPKGHTLTGVEFQSSKYTFGLPDQVPVWHRPLPFAYESTGAVTQFTNALDPEPCSREAFTFHRPEELLRLVQLDTQLRGRLQQLPPLDTEGLWAVQTTAITNVEHSLAHQRLRALVQMATGSGKTYTTVSLCYRLIKFAKARRILFLVDRNNLGRQAFNEFQQYQSIATNYSFTEEYPVQRLTKNTIDPAAKVVITTIQRLYSILRGEPEYREENEEESLFESASPLGHEALPVVYNPLIPIETFDFIVIDECHRSIYNLWRQVLEYFDAFLIGLTATPSPQTIGFFHGNVVQDYSHQRAVADGVNVGYDVYRIATRITAAGATLASQPGFFVPHRDRRTLKRRMAELDGDLTYTANQLNVDVVSMPQLRLIVQTFRDRLFTEIFPGRIDVPKTLVFARNDLHAEDIVKVIRAEFGKGNDFCVKITSKTTGEKPETLLQRFRNSYLPRIAVTVDMIATGTDVKAIECLLFLRNVNSASYFEQMKGRGVRIIDHDSLRAVSGYQTPSKTRFVIVDAVGVCARDKTQSKPLDRKPSVSFDKVLSLVAQGVVHPDLVSTLAARLARLALEMNTEQAAEVRATAGQPIEGLTTGLLESLDPDLNEARARVMFKLPPDTEPTEQQLDAAERAAMGAALRPFCDPALRELLLRIKRSLEQVIDEVNEDELLTAGFDSAARDKAQAVMGELRAFCEAHRDDIEALQLLYRKPHRAGLRYRQIKELAKQLNRAPFHIDPAKPDSVLQLWRTQRQAEPEQTQGEPRGLVDLIALVRHALHPQEPVIPLQTEIEARYLDWLNDQATRGITFSPEQREWLDMIKNHVATSLAIDREDFQETPFIQRGGLGKVYQLFGDKLEMVLDELNERLAA
ncbi:DEAD/DEAH box helicase family protein [uncultured Thiodictyon sp.]|uniref:type I restriction endonuclease subunit R n=1 Tax=uncultured Thiodictyon sp. TaxID=1846217 RepID=UPI0025FF602E|nr:DEAD/DEAH box helicase family protein [uncultured Thiodictyon sp.]